jgi:hypothetical protein
VCVCVCVLVVCVYEIENVWQPLQFPARLSLPFPTSVCPPLLLPLTPTQSPPTTHPSHWPPSTFLHLRSHKHSYNGSLVPVMHISSIPVPFPSPPRDFFLLTSRNPNFPDYCEAHLLHPCSLLLTSPPGDPSPQPHSSHL